MQSLEVIPVWRSIAGGALIGAAGGVLILFDGRIAGISGILGKALRLDWGTGAWRASFLLGLLLPGLMLGTGDPRMHAGAWTLALSGLLVGYGTGRGHGCVSGHGVCGVANLSLRSVVATVVFIGMGMVTVLVTRRFGLLP